MQVVEHVRSAGTPHHVLQGLLLVNEYPLRVPSADWRQGASGGSLPRRPVALSAAAQLRACSGLPHSQHLICTFGICIDIHVMWVMGPVRQG